MLKDILNSRLAVAVLAIAFVILAAAPVGSGSDADTLLGDDVAIAAASTEVDMRTVTGRNSVSGFTGWIFENDDGADNVECQFDPAAPVPSIGARNQLRIKAGETVALTGFVARQKFRCIAAGDGASLRITAIGH